MSHPFRRPQRSLLLIPAMAIVVAACSGGGASTPPTQSPTSGPSSAPSDAPSSPPVGDVVDYATGATDVILRYDMGPGFVMAGYAATMVPPFTLYGDGTVIFRDPALEIPPAQGSVFVMNPMRIATLSEAQIQELLVFALGEGGLAAARPDYRNDMVADAGTAIFTIRAGGIEKTVSIYALGIDTQGGVDAPARAAFLKLADRLTTLDKGGAVTSEVYVPTTYRAVLLEAAGLVAPDIRTWPWDDIAITDFKPSADPNGLQFPHLDMTQEQLDVLDVKDFEGGYQGLPLTGPDGLLYTLNVRPLLPDEG